ncbi:MAG: hypothetical protein MJB57_11530 [Gemmatimonadetes bacterium]|nr:hypothetical protein [Gemmatimonadota bacterium]
MNPGLYAADIVPLRSEIDATEPLGAIMAPAPEGVRSAACFVLVPGEDPEDALGLLGQIRRHPDPAIYLKPVLLVRRGAEPLPEALTYGVDAIWDRDAEPARPGHDVEAELRAIGQRAGQLSPVHSGGDLDPTVRVLRFLAVRGGTFAPRQTVLHPAGWTYDRLEPLADSADGDVARLLMLLAERQLLEGEFVARTHSCSSCNCAFLNFQETCPRCTSADLLVQDWVHHFRCAYTGPMSDFEYEGRLVCPKCEHLLRHLGTDYDKPAIVYQCRECENEFHEADVVSACYQCGHSAPPDMQGERYYRRYTVTALGRNLAIYGVDETVGRVLSRSGRVLPFDSFRTLVAGEAARHERYRTEPGSALVLVNLVGLQGAYLELGERTGELLEQLLETVVSIMRTSDYIATPNNSLFAIVLTETGVDAAETAVERLEGGIAELLQGSLSDPPNVTFAIESITKDLDLDGTLDRMLGRHAA